ncbi:MAG: YebC/PmpR family DNA-binding transcriptional regulator [Candidatus Promineifilaceae bacterium]|nr:YebC/PmpR family DNA-binding transcriptional regulator [Candidatus Promineifilaceae bacterium]
MSGHSKWSTIKHKKAVTDARRGKLFTRLTKEITIAAREKGGDPEFNPRLRLAIDKAKEANMPKDNIERAIKRGTGELEGQELVEIVYEGYAPHGVGMLVEVVTDNRNRAVAELRHALNKYGGSMAEAGAVSWQFSRKGFISVKGEVEDQDELFLTAADAGAEDLRFEDGQAEVYTDLNSFAQVRDTLEEAGYELDEATMIYEANNPLSLPQNQAVQVLRVIEQIEELDDVQNLYSALDVTDEALAAVEAD